MKRLVVVPLVGVLAAVAFAAAPTPERAVDCARPMADVVVGWPRSGLTIRRLVRGSVPQAQMLRVGGPALRPVPLPPWSFPTWAPDGQAVAAYQLVGFVAHEIDVFRSGAFAFKLWSGESPAWSPDGSRLAWVLKPRFGRPVIHVVRADGSGDHAVASGSEPAWAPDGSHIVYKHDAGVAIVGADGSDDHLLRAGPFGEPSFSADGRWLAFRVNSTYLVLTRPDATGLRRLGRAGAFAWAPRGEVLAFDRRNTIALYDVPTGQTRTLADDAASKQGPTWSPSGNAIAYTVFERVPETYWRGHDALPPRARAEVWTADARTLVEHRVTYHCQTPMPWSRTVRGTHLADTIRARDGRAERIVCGAGRDTVVADRRDAVSRDCERVETG